MPYIHAIDVPGEEVRGKVLKVATGVGIPGVERSDFPQRSNIIFPVPIKASVPPVPATWRR
jgi:hypothetical protein